MYSTFILVFVFATQYTHREFVFNIHLRDLLRVLCMYSVEVEYTVCVFGMNIRHVYKSKIK